MEIAFALVALAVAVLTFTALAERVDFPPPLLLIVVGVVASYLPFVPEVHLDHDVVLLGLLPPLRTPPRSRRRWSTSTPTVGPSCC